MNKNKGFTLIELLVVIAIIGILSTVVVINVNRARIDARNAAVEANLVAVRIEAEFVFDDTGGYAAICAVDGTLNEVQSAGLGRIETAILGVLPANQTITCHADVGNFCVQTVRQGTAYYICVDHLGHSGTVTTSTCAALTIRCI